MVRDKLVAMESFGSANLQARSVPIGCIYYQK